MRGHIRKRGKNSWTVVLPLPRDPETGKPRQKWVTVRGSRKDAEAVLAKLLAEAHAGGLGTAPAKLTLGEYLEKWLEAVRLSVRKEGTVRNYRTCVRIWERTGITSVPLEKLNPLLIQTALGEMVARGLKPGTCRTAFSVLRAALRRAVEWGLITANPAEKVKPPAGEEGGAVNVWAEEEAAGFLEAAKRSRYYPLFVLALSTGLRLGELLGLKWEDVDLEAGCLQVKRILAGRESDGTPVFTPPKTASSRRRVPLDSFTVEVLRRHKKRQAEARLKKGPAWQDHGLVFCTSRGLPLARPNVWLIFNLLARRAGVPEIRFHDLRHTHATFLLRQGVHPKVVAERLGHSSVKVTLDTYSHVLPDTQREAVRAVEEFFSAKSLFQKPGR
ncbi:tyrosine-type recombinase/integrase [Desulfovirgula thermocuniculi]|uniref:tyrosine-type recombinase/integrase n=1 Tax=Desulfovirgula thermocuniculi TaxID=348842 RepID=UPI0003FF9937|nr:tyrosine-type recombinase/integrase [Desulfovirgula thermocuniculi]